MSWYFSAEKEAYRVSNRGSSIFKSTESMGEGAGGVGVAVAAGSSGWGSGRIMGEVRKECNMCDSLPPKKEKKKVNLNYLTKKQEN